MGLPEGWTRYGADGNIFHRRMTRRETPSEVKARLLSKSQTGFSSHKSK